MAENPIHQTSGPDTAWTIVEGRVRVVRAIISREFGIPCVINTGDGTAALRTGDVVRVDGTAGTVTVLSPS